MVMPNANVMHTHFSNHVYVYGGYLCRKMKHLEAHARRALVTILAKEYVNAYSHEMLVIMFCEGEVPSCIQVCICM